MKAASFVILLTIGAMPLRAADPLVASTYLGSGSWGDDEGISSVALDAAGNVYVAGWVESDERAIPFTDDAFQTNFGGGTMDAMVAKFDPTLSTLEACTYLGGTGRDSANAIQVAANGNVYVAGFSASPDFPTTPGVFSNQLNAASMDGFICVFDPELTNVVACTLIGGEGSDEIRAMKLAGGNVYIAGTAWYDDFPTTPGATDRSWNGGGDVFVGRLDPSLTTLHAAGMIGGHHDEEVHDLAVDVAGNMYVVGYSDSSPNLHTNDFPTTGGAYDRVWGTDGTGWRSDGIICRFAPNASLLASTLIGGDYYEDVRGIDLDSAGNVYLTGSTTSDEFPVTPGAYATTTASFGDAFVAKLSSDLGTLLSATYLGGERQEQGNCIQVGPLGVYVTGWTESDQFPFTPGAYQEDNEGDEDVFICRFDLDLTHLFASSQIGNRDVDAAHALLIGDAPDYPVYVGGSSNYRFPTTPGAYDSSFGNSSSHEGFVCIFAQPAALMILGDGVQPGGGNFMLRWTSNPGHRYSIQCMENPATPEVWTPVTGDILATPPVNSLPVTIPPGAGFQCYRLGSDDGIP